MISRRDIIHLFLFLCLAISVITTFIKIQYGDLISFKKYITLNLIVLTFCSIYYIKPLRIVVFDI